MRTLSIIAATAGFAGAAVLAGALVAAGNGASLTAVRHGAAAALPPGAARATPAGANGPGLAAARPGGASAGPASTAHPGGVPAAAAPEAATSANGEYAGSSVRPGGRHDDAWPRGATRETASSGSAGLPEVEPPSRDGGPAIPVGGGTAGGGSAGAASGAGTPSAPVSGGAAAPAGALIATGTPLATGTSSTTPGTTTGGSTTGDGTAGGSGKTPGAGTGDSGGDSGKGTTGGKDQPGKDKPGGTKPPPSGPPQVRLAVSGTPGPGAQLAVRVMFDNARGVASVPFHLLFEPSVLRFTRATQGTLLTSDGQQAALMAAVTADGNRLVVGDARLGAATGISGSGEVCTLWFAVVGSGVSPLVFDQASVWIAGGGTSEATFENATVVVP